MLLQSDIKKGPVRRRDGFPYPGIDPKPAPAEEIPTKCGR
ncbi:hypothetical protein BCO37747_03532 [Burkholderia contaminans]|jgi:hypothetical protein|nr:hypothetical protein BCO23253_04893 [Burkholderia contaminans]VWD15552.1 hypothetical protein BCO37747_03532 [Burkholderia contaminans]